MIYIRGRIKVKDPKRDNNVPVPIVLARFANPTPDFFFDCFREACFDSSDVLSLLSVADSIISFRRSWKKRLYADRGRFGIPSGFFQGTSGDFRFRLIFCPSVPFGGTLAFPKTSICAFSIEPFSPSRGAVFKLIVLIFSWPILMELFEAGVSRFGFSRLSMLLVFIAFMAQTNSPFVPYYVWKMWSVQIFLTASATLVDVTSYRSIWDIVWRL